MSNFLNLSKFSICHSGQSYPSVKLVVFVKTLKFVKKTVKFVKKTVKFYISIRFVKSTY